MSERIATTLGLYPLPDWAKSTLADLKGHQKHDLISGTESDEIESVYEEVRTELVETQTDTGLDRVVEGQARWDDLLAHPLAVHDSVDTRGIVRYYDNNNFYRDPVVADELDFSGDVARELETAAAHTDALQAVLPGPYSLADLATDEYYGDDAEFLAAIGDFLAEEAEAFPDVETLFLLEPSLVVDPPGEGADERASEAIDAIASAVDADVVVQTYWGALEEKVHAHLLDASIDAVGYDLVSAPHDSLYLINEYGTKDDVSFGLVSGQNTLVESAKTVDERIQWVHDNTPVATFDTIYLTPNTELFYLPVNKFEAKLQSLATAAAKNPDTEADPAEVNA